MWGIIKEAHPWPHPCAEAVGHWLRRLQPPAGSAFMANAFTPQASFPFSQGVLPQAPPLSAATVPLPPNLSSNQGAPEAWEEPEGSVWFYLGQMPGLR